MLYNMKWMKSNVFVMGLDIDNSYFINVSTFSDNLL